MNQSRDDSRSGAPEGRAPGTGSSGPGETAPKDDGAELIRLMQALEEARQRVAPLIRKEAEGEKVTEDVLNFRLSR